LVQHSPKLQKWRGLFNKVMGRLAGAPERISLATESHPPLKIGLYGMCQFELLAKACEGNGAGHVLRHELLQAYRHAEIPPPQASDDLAVFALSLSQIMMDATGLPFPAADLFLARARSIEDAEALLAQCRALLEQKVAAIQLLHWGRPAVYLGFFEPTFNGLGDLQNPYDIRSSRQFVRYINQLFATAIEQQPNAYFLDVNTILNEVGRQYLQDDVVLQDLHGSLINAWPFKLDIKRKGKIGQFLSAARYEAAIRRYAAHFLQRIERMHEITRQRASVKLIICDLDDTLWRGIAAEDDNMSDNDRIEGWPTGLIEALLYFKARGGILALASKNDHAPTMERFSRIYRGAISFDDFASVKVNWLPKSQNISEILAEANLLARNALFIDDNPRELSEVRRVHPELRCLGPDFYNWRKSVLYAAETQVPVITAESLRRTELVRASAGRAPDAAANGATGQSREEWLVSLGLKQSVSLAAKGSKAYERAFELLNKTNQFNTNGQRWTAGELVSFIDGGGRCLVSTVQDNEVDNGIISVCLIHGEAIEQMVLSCRVFGLGVEDVVASAAVDIILRDNPRATATWIDTGRNATCRGFYERLGFARESDAFFIDNSVAVPAHITVSANYGKTQHSRKATLLDDGRRGDDNQEVRQQRFG
jgi:FkbH-like protein